MMLPVDSILNWWEFWHSGDLLTLSYGRLFEVWREETGSDAAQLTFAECGQPKG